MFGLSKQGYYKRLRATGRRQREAEQIKALIEPVRKKMPRYGTEKLLLDIKEQLQVQGIKMGRDRFIDFCRANCLLVRRSRRSYITTDSKHYFFKSPNLIKDLAPTQSEQVFVSDITYIKLENRYAYLALVTDLYSKKIMGYKLDDNMKVSLVKEALQMALRNCEHNRSSIIHHSDRGIQYCCPDYSRFAQSKGMILSTTERSDPYENAVAERINGILKYEFGLIKTIPSLEIAGKMLQQAVALYNKERRHRSLQMQTPDVAHTKQQHIYQRYQNKKTRDEQKTRLRNIALSTNDETVISQQLK